jgi:iron complex outermembrane receptor protein
MLSTIPGIILISTFARQSGKMNRTAVISLIILFNGLGVQAQDLAIVADTQNLAFDLGEVQVIGQRNNPLTNILRREDLVKNQQRDVSGALVLLPGLNYVEVGPRNEGMVNVRGFDLRQVPVYIDGVPVYVSYDGYTDLARFLVSDLAKITVTKGETSLLMGPNNLGGAINLVSSKPGSKLEMDAAAGITMNRKGWGGWQSDLNIGSRLEKFYLQAGLAYIDRESFNTSKKYTAPSPEHTGIQENSHHNDLRYSMKIGFTPNPSDGYVLSYHFQHGSKGVPPYSGTDPNQQPRYWQFPAVSKHGIHFNSKTKIGAEKLLQMRFFYDDYFSDLRSYDDSTYISQDRRSSFTSIYDDTSIGGSVIYTMKPGEKNELKAAVNVVNDHHREKNTHPVEQSLRHFRDVTLSVGVEDYFKISENLSTDLGLSYQIRNNLQADNYNETADSIYAFPGHNDEAVNLRMGLRYLISPEQQLLANLSRKTRFPTMKDRYSYRLGRSIPNPELRSEASWNMDLGYAYIPGTVFQFKTAIFYSRLHHTIQAVYGVDPENSSVYQFQNTGDAEFYGWEADLALNHLSSLQSGLQYTLIKRVNLSHPEIKFTDVPMHKLLVFLRYTLFSRLFLNLNGIYNSPRISSSSGMYQTRAFFTMDFISSFDISRSISLEASVSNLFDADYSYVEGYPAPGRQYFLGLRYQLR